MPGSRGLFAFASYNAGPARVAKLRGGRGLDPNVWFHNVENLAAERVGQETVRYVGNIFNYCVAYRLAQGAQDERARVREQLRAGAAGASGAGTSPTP